MRIATSGSKWSAPDGIFNKSENGRAAISRFEFLLVNRPVVALKTLDIRLQS